MRYTVVWVGTADRALIEIWLRATDRGAVTRAAQAIDRALQSNPEAVGESRDFGQRIVFAPPLAVICAVHQRDMLVKVLRVWSIRPRTS